MLLQRLNVQQLKTKKNIKMCDSNLHALHLAERRDQIVEAHRLLEAAVQPVRQWCVLRHVDTVPIYRPCIYRRVLRHVDTVPIYRPCTGAYFGMLTPYLYISPVYTGAYFGMLTPYIYIGPVYRGAYFGMLTPYLYISVYLGRFGTVPMYRPCNY